MGVVGTMVLDNEEIEITLNKHEERLDGHDKEINELKITSEVTKQKLSGLEKSNENILSTLTRLETNTYSGQNALTQAMTQVLINTSNNNTEIIKTDKNNRKDIIVKILSVTGILLAGILIGDRINIGSLIMGLF